MLEDVLADLCRDERSQGKKCWSRGVDLKAQIFSLNPGARLTTCHHSEIQCSVQGHIRYVCFLPKRCIAIGTVLARPDKNSDQPSTLRGSRFNLSASSRPAPSPMTPRVA